MYSILPGIAPKAAAPIAGAAALSGTDKGETAGKALTYGPAALMAPSIAEEVRASTKGLNMIRKADGLREAAKHAPKLTRALGTYGAIAVAPLAAGSIASRVRDRNKK